MGIIAQLFKFKKENEDKISYINKKQKKIKEKTALRIAEEQGNIEKKINQFIEEAREIGKEEAKQEIKKLEEETVKKINQENEEKEEAITSINKDYNQKVVEMEKKTNDKIDELTKLVYEELAKYNKTK